MGLVVFNDYKVSVQDDEKILNINTGDGYITP